MSDVASMPATLPVALVYGDAEACAHLRTALAEFNADIVYDSPGDDLDRTALGASGAKVAVVNLDDVLDPSLDEVYGVLEACGCRVVFNDPNSSVTLEGWEHARWVRHLAAKLRDDVDVDPPRPADAEPVNVAEAAHLGDQWLDDALGVLAADDGTPGAGSNEQQLESAVGLDAVQIPADELGGDLDAAFTLEPVESRPDTSAGSEVPSATGAAADVDAVADLDFATGPDAAAQADAAGSVPVPSVVEPALADSEALTDNALPEDALAIDWSLLDDDNVDAAETTAPASEAVAEGLDAMFDRGQQPLADDDFEFHAGETPAVAAATALPDEPPTSDLPPSSQWTLVDDTVAPPPSGKPFVTDDDAAKPKTTRVPGQSIAESLADRDFGIELVDPIEYLAPEAPPRETELYTAPELMSMAEALAPQQIDENIHAEAVAKPLPRVVVMAASIGGPDAVREFLSGLPENFPAVFILTQHMGTEFIDMMVKQLSKFSALPVRVPVSGERAGAGEVLVVPNGAELTLSRKGAIEMTNAAEAADQEPTITATMSMASRVFGADTLAIIFSGMVADTAAAARAVVDGGGSVWAQDAASCVVSTMVDSVNEAGVVKYSATPALLAQHLIEQFAKESAP